MAQATTFAPPGYAHVSSGFTGLVTLTHPQNIGSVRLRSTNPEDTPRIRMNHLQSQSDVKKLIAGVKLIRQLFHDPGFDEFRGREVAPGADVQSDEVQGTVLAKKRLISLEP